MWDSQSLGYQYAHNFTEWRGRKIASGSDYQGPGAQDVFSLSWDAKRGNLAVMANLLAGVGIVGQPGAKNVRTRFTAGLPDFSAFRRRFSVSMFLWGRLRAAEQPLCPFRDAIPHGWTA